MHSSLRLPFTGILVAGLLTACGGGGDNTTGASATESSTGGSSTTSGTTTMSPTNDGTTEGSLSGTGSTGPDPTTEVDPTTGVDPTTSPEATTTPESTSTGPVTTLDTDPDTSGTTFADTSGTSTTGEPGLCPPMPNDDPCATCNKENCCDEILACADSEKCSCFTDCLQMGGEPPMCTQMCEINNPNMVPELGALRACNMENCMDACEGP
jgi:hypothetical protein